MNEELDPEDLVEQYKTLSNKYHAEAMELLKEGNLVQASEKLWGATALAVKRIAAERDLKLEKHGGLWDFVNMISKESRDKEIVTFFGVANTLHRNFYENEMPKESIEISAENIDTLITKLKGM